MPKLRPSNDPTSRIYDRGLAGAPRYYADFRDFANEGGKLQALIGAGEQRATGDHALAVSLTVARLAALQAVRKVRPAGVAARRTFSAFADHHLCRMATNDVAEKQWLESAERHLRRAADFFGAHIDLAQLDVAKCAAFQDHMRRAPNGRGGIMSSQSVSHHMNSLSSMLGRALSEQVLPAGANPVGLIYDEIVADAKATPWLEADEMSVMLRAARELRPTRGDLAAPFWFPLVATYAYTGARETEALGFQRSDYDFERGRLRFQPNKWRRLKSEKSDRTVPLFPQYVRIMREYLDGPDAPTGDLMFPCIDGDGAERMLTDFRKVLDKLPVPARLVRPRTAAELLEAEGERLRKVERIVAKGRGPKPVETLDALMAPVSTTIIDPIRTRMLRHSWCTARLQTLVHGSPIAVFQVAKEMGHADSAQVDKRYGHLGVINYRSEHVEFDLDGL